MKNDRNRSQLLGYSTYYASLLKTADSLTNVDEASVSFNQYTAVNDGNTSDVESTANAILTKLAVSVNQDSISKFSISRNFIWEGTKRARSRKSFSPNSKGFSLLSNFYVMMNNGGKSQCSLKPTPALIFFAF